MIDLKFLLNASAIKQEYDPTSSQILASKSQSVPLISPFSTQSLILMVMI